VAATEATIAAGARGDKLKVSGTVFDSKCRPLSGAAVNAWQATADGAYGPGQDKGELHCCYLTGGVRTNQAGRYEFDTVMPGRYQSHPAYIHIAVTHSRAGQLLTEVHFAADPLEGSGEQFTVVRLTKAADGGLLATFDIVLAGY
jgi:protocatechuate 3,4-dioxygenase beta subunit